MNLLSTFINSGEKRPRSESPTPDDPLETTVLTALQKFLPSLVAQMSEKVVDTLKATIEVTVAAAVEPLKTEIGQLASRVGTIEEQFTFLGSNIDSILDAKVDSKVATRVGTVDETVRATYEAIDNNVNHCLLSIETLERKFRSPHAILFGVAESLGEKHLAEVKTLLGAPSIYETIRLGKHSPTAPRPRPVLIKFTSVAAKHAAYKKAKDLRRQFSVSMDDDLTPQQKAARMSRQPEVHTLRGEGWITFWRGDQLFKVKAGGAPLKVPVGAPAAHAHAAPTAAPAPTSSPAAGLTPSTSSGAAGPSPMCA
jgi:hypothetical protein